MVIDLTGHVALVTGAGTGIGRATARVLARYGAAVALAGHHHDNIAETARLVEADGGQALPILCDVSIEADVAAMVERTVGQWGRLDIACNNAGIFGRLEPLTALDADSFETTVGTNQRGVFLCMVHEMRHITDPGGSIVNISSINGVSAAAGGSLYCSTKAAVEMMTRVAALEGAPGVRVNAIRPGFVLTPMHDAALELMGGATPQVIEQVEGSVPLRRRAQPEEIGEAVAWLCSQNASYITGEVITVDGGLTLSSEE